MSISIREYTTREGRSPFRGWLEGLDVSVRARIQARILRFEMGNLGDHRSVGGGVWEARMDFGPGYRLYFGMLERSVILLLVGGHKGSQPRDIRRAQYYLSDYLEASEHDKAQ